MSTSTVKECLGFSLRECLGVYLREHLCVYTLSLSGNCRYENVHVSCNLSSIFAVRDYVRLFYWSVYTCA